MKRKIILKSIALIIILFISFNSNAQQQYAMICTMGEREILRSQSFSEDAPEAEIARDLLQEFLVDLNYFYTKLNEGLITEAQSRIPSIMARMDEAGQSGFNFSMFANDIEFIQENY